MMQARFVLLGILLVGGGACVGSGPRQSVADEQAIKSLYEQFSHAVAARNADTIMSFYAPDADLVAFDAFPPRQYLGASSYRKAYEGFFAAYPGPVTSEISDLRITAEGTLAFTSCIDRWVATSSDRKATEIVFRVTNGLRKVDGRWRIAHEHLSVPVDPASGKADFQSKP